MTFLFFFIAFFWLALMGCHFLWDSNPDSCHGNRAFSQLRHSLIFLSRNFLIIIDIIIIFKFIRMKTYLFIASHPQIKKNLTCDHKSASALAAGSGSALKCGGSGTPATTLT
jgi:hypothetical protein